MGIRKELIKDRRHPDGGSKTYFCSNIIVPLEHLGPCNNDYIRDQYLYTVDNQEFAASYYLKQSINERKEENVYLESSRRISQAIQTNKVGKPETLYR